MTYKDLSDEEFTINVTEQIAKILISIAWSNSNFVCSECLKTIEKLEEVLDCLDGAVADEVMAEVKDILE